jgi:hypothetical protein
MDGSSTAVIVIPIVTTISLALWLIIVFYAAAHPRWRRRQTRTANPEVTRVRPAHDIPAPRRSPEHAPGSGQLRLRGSVTVTAPPRATGRRPLNENAEPREGRDEKHRAYAHAASSREEDRLLRVGPPDRKAGL